MLFLKQMIEDERKILEKLVKIKLPNDSKNISHFQEVDFSHIPPFRTIKEKYKYEDRRGLSVVLFLRYCERFWAVSKRLTKKHLEDYGNNSPQYQKWVNDIKVPEILLNDIMKTLKLDQERIYKIFEEAEKAKRASASPAKRMWL